MDSRSKILKESTPLARALPGARFTERHALAIAAPPDRVWAALHTVAWEDLRWTRPLMAVRFSAAALARSDRSGRGSRGSRGGAAPGKRLLDPPSPAAPVFEDPPRFCASGMIARPWTPVPTMGPRVTSLDELRDFSEPGWLKFGMEWMLTPIAGQRTMVETTTLCEPTDAAARLRFTAYWIVIRAFSGLIRRDMLAAVAREAATAASAPTENPRPLSDR